MDEYDGFWVGGRGDGEEAWIGTGVAYGLGYYFGDGWGTGNGFSGEDGDGRGDWNGHGSRDGDGDGESPFDYIEG